MSTWSHSRWHRWKFISLILILCLGIVAYSTQILNDQEIVKPSAALTHSQRQCIGLCEANNNVIQHNGNTLYNICVNCTDLPEAPGCKRGEPDRENKEACCRTLCGADPDIGCKWGGVPPSSYDPDLCPIHCDEAKILQVACSDSVCPGVTECESVPDNPDTPVDDSYCGCKCTGENTHAENGQCVCDEGYELSDDGQSCECPDEYKTFAGICCLPPLIFGETPDAPSGDICCCPQGASCAVPGMVVCWEDPGGAGPGPGPGSLGGSTGGDSGDNGGNGDSGDVGPGPGPGPGSTSSTPPSSAASSELSSASSNESSTPSDPSKSSESSNSSFESSSESSSESLLESSESSSEESSESSSSSILSSSVSSLSSSDSSGFSSSISSEDSLCGNGLVDQGEECDNGSVCSNNEFLTCPDEVICNKCFIVNQTSGEARCAANPDGRLCFSDADCATEAATCDYNILRNTFCTTECRWDTGSSASSIDSTSSDASASNGSSTDTTQNSSNNSNDSNDSFASSIESNNSSADSNDSSVDSTASTGSHNSEISNSSIESAGSSESTIIALNSSVSSDSLTGIGVCGNGFLEGIEQCDDGNNRSGDGCSTYCDIEEDGDIGDVGTLQDPYCGNGILQSGEQCDDGNQRNNDGCSSTCVIIPVFDGCFSNDDCSNGVCINGDCTPCYGDAECGDGVCDSGQCVGPKLVAAASVCGNGLLEVNEECDDSNRRDNDGCNSTCLLEIGICGDGVVQSLLGEQCESSLHDSSLPYTCSNCRFLSTFCGNNTVDAGEECDDGPRNSTSADASCRPDCSLSRCGDGILDSAELCDDGNVISGDGCDRYCREEKETLIASEYTPPNIPEQLTQPEVPPQQYQFPQYPTGKSLPYQLPLAQLRPLVQGQSPIGDTGPAAVAVIGAGAAAGVGWIRRKRK